MFYVRLSEANYQNYHIIIKLWRLNYLRAVNLHDQRPSSTATVAKISAIHTAVDRKVLAAKLEHVCFVFSCSLNEFQILHWLLICIVFTY